MANYCYRCGRELAEGMNECPVCDKDTRFNNEDINEDIRRYAPVASEEPEKKVCGFGAYFGLILLFAIPVVGFIAAIICSLAPKNKNIKHFAGATIVWQILGVVISAVIVISSISAVKGVANVFLGYVENITGGQISGIDDAFALVQDLNRITDIINKIQNGEIEGIPRSVTDIITKYKNGEITSLPGELLDILEQYQNGEIPEIPKDIDDIIDKIPEKIPDEIPDDIVDKIPDEIPVD